MQKGSELYNREALIEQVEDWIETTPLAEAIIDAMEEVAEPEEMTFQNAKAIWYDFLEHELSDGLKRCVHQQF